MSKTIALARVSFSTYLTYRATFIFWRFRNLISYLALIVFWQALFSSGNEIFSYTKNEMMTYVVGIGFISNAILSSFSGYIAEQIRSGEITKDLMLPISIFKKLFVEDLIDKGFNIIFFVPEMVFLSIVFHITPIMPDSILTIGIFIIFLLSAMFLFFYLNVFLSLTAFWTDDVWAVRWLFGVILFDFFSGLYFPLDVLPHWVLNVIRFTPFPYLAYFPMKLWLGDISTTQGIQAVGITMFWGILFYFIATKLFKRGVRDYGAFGN